MRFLVDTNVLSELRKGRNGDVNLQRWAGNSSMSDFAISVINLLEIEAGILRISRRDPPQGLVYRAWLDHLLLPQLADRVLPVDAEIAIRCAALNVPDPRPTSDSLIAATALVHNLIVVTRNTGDFAGTGVRLFNPWMV